MATANTPPIEVGCWGSNPNSYDPSAWRCEVRVAGRVYAVSNTLGPGYDMAIRPTTGPDRGRIVGWARWEDWASVAKLLAAHGDATGVAA